MFSKSRLLLALPVAAGLLAAPTLAHAEWYHRGGGGYQQPYRGGGYHGGYYRGGYYRGPGPGAYVAGALLGLGAAAVVGSILAPPPVYYAPPPVVYAPPPVYYAQPPVAYAPPPVSYTPPGYYGN
jgi:hypothetical protein